MEALRLAPVFGDHMVLGRRRPLRLFGEAADGARVTAVLQGFEATATAREGRFLLTLPPMEAGGPYTLTVTDGPTTITLTDVMVGEVYLAGGQSNMEMDLQNSDNGRAFSAETNQPLLRFFNCSRQPWLDEQAKNAERRARWRIAKPGACSHMSAVAYHFATRLQKELGMAVGIIDCYWGGTSVACWLDEATLRTSAAGEGILRQYAQRVGNKTDAQYLAENRAHEAAVLAWNNALEALRTQEPGVGWPDIIRRIGTCPWNPPVGRKSPYRPAGLVETMLKRVAPYPITGFLYYQGEEDVGRASEYRLLMTQLIAFWRTLFRGEELPFLFVQLPMFRNSYEEDDRQWPQLRLAQEQVWRQTAHTGLAVMIDGGELDNIHPTDKQTVGERLFAQAMRVAYGATAIPDSPRALYACPVGACVEVMLDAPVTANGNAALFELAGADGQFYPARAAMDGRIIRLTAEAVPEPVAARYAWVNYGITNVTGNSGLPLAPFWLA